MKVTLNDIFRSQRVIQKLSEHPMPIRTAYRISKILQPISHEYDTIEKLRIQLVSKYGEEKDGKKEVPPEKVNDFVLELQELLSSETEVEFEPLSLQDLPENLTMTPQELASIDFMLTEKETD